MWIWRIFRNFFLLSIIKFINVKYFSGSMFFYLSQVKLCKKRSWCNETEWKEILINKKSFSLGGLQFSTHLSIKYNISLLQVKQLFCQKTTNTRISFVIPKIRVSAAPLLLWHGKFCHKSITETTKIIPKTTLRAAPHKSGNSYKNNNNNGTTVLPITMANEVSWNNKQFSCQQPPTLSLNRFKRLKLIIVKSRKEVKFST